MLHKPLTVLHAVINVLHLIEHHIGVYNIPVQVYNMLVQVYIPCEHTRQIVNTRYVYEYLFVGVTECPKTYPESLKQIITHQIASQLQCKFADGTEWYMEHPAIAFNFGKR